MKIQGMNSFYLLCSLFLVVLLMSGCGSSVHVSVNSICVPQQPADKSCVLVSDDKTTTEQDLIYQQFAGYMQRVIANKGYTIVKDINEAVIVIMLSYGITEPQEHLYSYSTPVYGQNGYSSANTHGTINSYGNRATYSGTTTYTPSYGVVGYQNHVGTYATCTRYISLEAKDKTTSAPFWKTVAVSTGTSCDLRRVFPVMAAAMSDYIETDTGQQVGVTLFERDSRVLQIKGSQ